MPKVKVGESEQDYVSRCIPIVMREGKTQEQAASQCYGMYRSAKKFQIVKSVLKNTINQIKDYTEKTQLIEKYSDELDEVMKARTVGGYESPEPGTLSEEGAALLARVYSKCRADGGDKERCAKIAHTAVTNAGYRKTASLQRIAKGIQDYVSIRKGIVQKQEKPIDEKPTIGETPKLKNDYFEHLYYPSFLMAMPFNLSNNQPNNDWMKTEENQQPIDFDKAFKQFIELYNIISSGAIVYIIPSMSGLQDQAYVANVGLKLPVSIAKNTFLLANFKSKPREKEEIISNKFFKLMNFDIVQPPTDWEGEAELKYFGDKNFCGGWGIRSDLESYNWMMNNFDMNIVPVKMSNSKLYHLDCLIFPIDNKNTLVATSEIQPNDLRQIEKITNIIDVPLNFALQGTTNSVRINNIIVNASSFLTMNKDDEKYELERDRVDFMLKTFSNYGVELVFINLSEYEKSGAAASCLIMHLNWFGYEQMQREK